MLEILMIGKESDSLSDLKTGFEKSGAKVTMVESSDDALIRCRKESVDLIVTDENVKDMSGLDCIRKLISANPMLNCAAVSPLPADVFHEESEGLGVLMQLPVGSGDEEAKKLLEHLQNILQLTKKADR